MSDLVDRYVYQVGRYLSKADRADIQAELRSLIEDKLEDRVEGKASEEVVAEVLKEMGSPLDMARSYGAEQYLVGPELYPTMMRVLRAGVFIIPLVIIIVNAVQIATGTSLTLIGLFVSMIINIFGSLLTFGAIVVGIFALIQHSGAEVVGGFAIIRLSSKDLPKELREKEWNPRDLPATDTPGKVGLDLSINLAGTILSALILIYFLQVGGLTIRFNFADPGTVIPVPISWLIVWILANIVRVPLYVTVLLRNRWDVASRLVDTAFDLLIVVCAYFVLWIPLWGQVLLPIIGVEDVAFMRNLPLFLSALNAFFTLIGGLDTTFKLWNQRYNNPPISVEDWMEQQAKNLEQQVNNEN